MRRPQALGLALLLALGATSCRTPAISPSRTPGSETSTAAPRRVVSLIPSATELIYEVGAQASLVGVTVNDDYPPDVKALPKVGDQTIDSERLLTLTPDLVVLDTEFNPDGPKFERLGLEVLALSSKRLTDIAKNLRLLGRRLGRQEQGEAAARAFETKLSKMPKLDSKDSVFIEIWGSPLMTVGSESLPDDLLRQIGLTNAYADQKGYFQVDPEDVLTRRPTIVILPSSQSGDQSAAAKLLRKAGVKVKVVAIDGDLFTQPGPRVTEGLRILLEELSHSAR